MLGHLRAGLPDRVFSVLAAAFALAVDVAAEPVTGSAEGPWPPFLLGACGIGLAGDVRVVVEELHVA